MLSVKLQSLAALHADGRGNGGKYCDDKIDDLLDGFPITQVPVQSLLLMVVADDSCLLMLSECP